MRGIILFDGVCNLCNGLVQFILKHDKKDHFKFASLQGIHGQKYLEKHDILSDMNTFIYIEGEKIYTRSTAAIQVAKHLPGLWKAFTIFIIIPKPLRDAMYSFVAKNRYQWFGKQDQCMLPKPEYKHKFLD